jgi:hypothetical protein
MSRKSDVPDIERVRQKSRRGLLLGGLPTKVME